MLRRHPGLYCQCSSANLRLTSRGERYLAPSCCDLIARMYQKQRELLHISSGVVARRSDGLEECFDAGDGATICFIVGRNVWSEDGREVQQA